MKIKLIIKFIVKFLVSLLLHDHSLFRHETTKIQKILPFLKLRLRIIEKIREGQGKDREIF